MRYPKGLLPKAPWVVPHAPMPLSYIASASRPKGQNQAAPAPAEIPLWGGTALNSGSLPHNLWNLLAAATDRSPSPPSSLLS
eukprot:scaffold174401_cov31-Tisochrysis_lutea.AAC.3